jgi:ankyrin repeat protein
MTSVPCEAVSGEALRSAAAKGQLSLVESLLRSSQINVAIYGLVAIRWAVRNGHPDVVQLLLSDARIDPAAATNSACARHDSGMLDSLVHDYRGTGENNLIVFAASKGHAAVVEILLNDKRVDPAAENNKAVRHAAHLGHTEAVEALLHDDRVDPAACDNHAIQWSARLGFTAVVQMLLQDARVDPTSCNNEALYQAISHEESDIVHLLLSDARVFASVIGTNDALHDIIKVLPLETVLVAMRHGALQRRLDAIRMRTWLQ